MARPFLIVRSMVFFVLLGVASMVPTAARAVVYGIDVSHWNNTIDWGEVGTTGIGFAFVKATEGVSFVDSKVTANVSGARDAGLLVGVYHFATPSTATNDAALEAVHFVEEAGQYMQDGYLPPVLDLETGSEMGVAALSAWANTFLNAVEFLSGVRPIIYTGSHYATNFLDAATVDAELWVANWGVSAPNTGTWDDYLFWQFSATGQLTGISTDVDFNEFNGSRADLAALVIPEPTTAGLLLAAGAGMLRGRRREC